MSDSASDTDGSSGAGGGSPDSKTAQLVYIELGRQIEQIDNVLEAFEDNNLAHTPACETLEERRGRFCMMRGVLQETADEDLRGGLDSATDADAEPAATLLDSEPADER